MKINYRNIGRSADPREQQLAMRTMLQPFEHVPCLAITLTFLDDTPYPKRRDYVKEFSKIVNTEIFALRPKCKRRGRKLVMFVAEEKSAHVQYHMALEIPPGWLSDDWIDFCSATWMDLTGSLPISNKFELMRDFGWIDYMLKRRDKPVYMDAFIFELMHLKSDFTIH